MKGPIHKSDVLNRLKRIEGQIKGIHKMIEDEKCCKEVMIQISAVRSAISKVGGMVIDDYIKDCMKTKLKEAVESGKLDDGMDEVIDVLIKYVK